MRPVPWSTSGRAELALTTSEMRELLVDRGGLALDDRTRSRSSVSAPKVGRPRSTSRRCGYEASTISGAPCATSAATIGSSLEYLSQEVLTALDPEERSFLLRAAALGRFTADLCDAVLGRSDSAAMLAELEQSNLFVLTARAAGVVPRPRAVRGVRPRAAGVERPRRRTAAPSPRRAAGCTHKGCSSKLPSTPPRRGITKPSPRCSANLVTR